MKQELLRMVYQLKEIKSIQLPSKFLIQNKFESVVDTCMQ